MQALLSYDQSPPIAAPFRFFLTAPVFAILAGALLLWGGPDALASRWTPDVLAVTHLITVGFMLQVMLGALIQVLPVVAGANLRQPMRLAAAVHVALNVGALVLGSAFLTFDERCFKGAAIILGTGTMLFLVAAFLALRGIPALPAGGAHIRVTFQVDADGLLSVTAMEKSTGVESSIQVKPSYGLTDGEIASMIQDSMSFAEQDVKARMLAEQKVEAARVLESLSGALNADAALLSAAERQVIDDAAARLSAVVEGNDADAIEEAIKNVDKQTQDFAARRMDKSVRVALKGQSVDEV